MNAYNAMLSAIADRKGDHIGVTRWRAVSPAEADVFDVLTGWGLDLTRRAPGPRRPDPLNPFHVLALMPSFSSEMGMPIATDAHITALSYGYDNVEWLAVIHAGEVIRDHMYGAGVELREDDRHLVREAHHIERQRDRVTVLTAVSLTMYILL